MDKNQDQFHPDIQRKIESGYHLDIKDLLLKSYTLVFNNLLIFSAFTFLYLVFNYIIFVKPSPIGSILQIVIAGPISAGYFYAIRRADVGFQLSFNDIFRGFEKFILLAGANMLHSIILFVGVIMLVIPGIYFMVSLIFIYPFLLFRSMEILPAFESSRLLVTREFWQWLLFLVILLVLNILGALMFGVGLLISLPISYAAVYFAFKQLIPIHDEYEKWEI